MNKVCTEIPVFSFHEYGIAFHFIYNRGKNIFCDWQDSSNEFLSFERDLLSFTYRNISPISSSTVPVPIGLDELEIIFPLMMTYEAEGEYKELVQNPDKY